MIRVIIIEDIKLKKVELLLTLRIYTPGALVGFY
jgi:hypothetical protein